jgi:predicted glycosyltransferase
VKIWIDLSNSPHALLFAPVARRLEELGHTVAVTARDNAQTVSLARRHWPDLEVIGGPSPPGRYRKARDLARRVRELHRWARAQRPALALSHNSYAQIVAARLAGVRVVTAMDFEHQPANHLAFRLAHRVVLPAPIELAMVRRQGLTPSKASWYSGLKEEVYLGDFEPDPAVLAQLGIELEDGVALVVARTPPDEAIYHRFGNPLFARVLERVGGEPARARCVVLARQERQREEVERMGLSGVIVPRDAIDSRSLMYGADLVVGAGGTMTREAALLGIPTVSLFAGARPAVDRWLEDRGLLGRIEEVEDLPPLGENGAGPRPMEEIKRRSEVVTEQFIEAALGAAVTPRAAVLD